MPVMYDLPLFPLHTVLFPHMPIALHIFEPRYRLMIEQCIQTGQPFGVVLIRSGAEAGGPLAEPHPIGCAAHITQIERLEDGRLNILAVGRERFQIHALSHEKPYLVGRVESLPLDAADASLVRVGGARLRPWVERYLSVLARVSKDAETDPTRLPDDPLALAYLAAALLQIPLDQKQALLATNQAATLLADIRTIYRREVALLTALADRESPQDQGVFSRN